MCEKCRVCMSDFFTHLRFPTTGLSVKVRDDENYIMERYERQIYIC